MKKLSYLLTLLLLVTLMTGCKAFHTLMDSKLKAAQGAPYELIVVCNQQLWESELGDTLRSVLLAPIPYLNEREPLFNVMQFPESGFKGTVVDPAIGEGRVDTTGAGDNFAAGFLYGLSKGVSLDRAGRIGSLLAGEVVKVVGPQIPESEWEQIKLKVGDLLG